jgi:uncharacterized protein
MVERVRPRHRDAVVTMLTRSPRVNLFLLGFLKAHRIDQAPWYGAFNGTELVGVLLVLPHRLAVPFCPDPASATALGRAMARRHRPCMMVGPRIATDRIWGAWAREVEPERAYDQRLYVMDRRSHLDAPDGLRQATLDDVGVVAEHAASMQREDLGTDPLGDPAAHLGAVRDRVLAGRTWVVERRGELVYQLNVGTSIELGCQVGGTYVPPEWRGRGIATRATAAVANRLLERHPIVTLHVHERNTPAVRAYERCGFRRADPYRLITVSP